MPGDVIIISGENFTAGADIELYLGTTLVNSTADDDRFGPTGGAGPNSGKINDLEFTVPAIAPGIYVLKVLDENGASTGTAHTFTVTAAPESDVALRGATYYPGDIISFDIATTEGNLGTMTVTISDPSGATWWTVTAVTGGAGPWTLTGTVNKRILYQDQIINGNPLTLPADAPLGTWNWTVGYTPLSTGTATKATGLFTVAALPTMQTVVDAIDDCCANLTTLLEDLDAKIVAIDGTVATIDTSIGTMEASLSSLDATISGLDNDIATIVTCAGEIEMSLDALDAVVAYVADDVVTIKTVLGDINGTITDMDDSIATIETSLGTVTMDVAALQTDVEDALPVTVDMMPVWIAAILSLIAAIAAIFAVVTIRQKIAG
jgi:flagellin-like hook-associated protein FlgL